MRNFEEAKILAKSKKFDAYVLEKRCGEYEVKGVHQCGGVPSNVVYKHRYTPDKAVLSDTKRKGSKSADKGKGKPKQKKDKSDTASTNVGADS